MKNRETDYVAVDRGVLAGLIESMKKIDVRGFESMDRLVGCVIVLQKLANQSAPETGEESEGKEE